MSTPVLIVTAPGEDELAAAFVKPLSDAGYEIAHRGTILPGESIVEETSKLLDQDCPIILCATVKAIGTGWAHQVINVARIRGTHKILIAKMDRDAYVDILSADTPIVKFFAGPSAAIETLLAALNRYYPTDGKRPAAAIEELEARYCEIALRTHDIIDLANLPEEDRHLATRQLELRKLYVALRVKPQQPPRGAADKEWFFDLEKQRGGIHATESSEIGAMPVPVGNRLSVSNRLVILGDPGAGKSTMIRWIATSYLLKFSNHGEWIDIPDVSTLPKADWLPLVIRCRDLDNSHLSGSLADAIQHVLKKLEIHQAEAEQVKEILLAKLRSGNCLLMIDGLDEVPDPTTRSRFCRQLESFHRAYPDTPIIVTSRIVGYREMGTKLGFGFEHLLVTGLTSEDKDDFARRWTAATEPPYRQSSAARELIAAIHSTDRIERLASNPMLLTTMALVKRKIGKLPTKRADLYADAVEVLLNWRSEVDEPIDKHEAIPQLEYIAYAMCDSGTQQLREDRALDLLRKMRSEYPRLHSISHRSPEEFLKALERRTGILVETGRVRYRSRLVSVFEFRHLTFQEYLAGLALVDGRHPNRDRSLSLAQRIAPLAERIVRSHEKDDAAESWREALRLCVSSCGDDDVDDLLRTISESRTTDRVALSHLGKALLAAQCLADEPNADVETATFLLDRLVSAIVTFKWRDGRKHAKLDNEQMELRRAAIDLWETRWARQLRDSILAELGRSEQDNVAELWDILAASARQLSNEQLRPRMKELVAEFRAGDALYGIVLALEMMTIAYTGRYVRIAGVIPVLLDMLAAGPPGADAAIWALGWMGVSHKQSESSRVSRWVPTAPQLNFILDVYKSICPGSLVGLPDIRERFFCWVLRENANEEVIEALIRRLSRPGFHGRAEAVEVIGLLGVTRAVNVLIDQLYQGDDQLRRESVRALGRIGVESARAPLENLLSELSRYETDRVGHDDTDPVGGDTLGQAIVNALSTTGDVNTFKLIATLAIGHRLEDLRARDLRGLREKIGAKANPIIRSMANSTNFVARRVGIALLDGDTSSESQNLISVAARDDIVEIRMCAVEAVARRGDEVDMIILSRDLDGELPFIDPVEPFNSARIAELMRVLRSTRTRFRKAEIWERLARISQSLGVDLISQE